LFVMFSALFYCIYQYSFMSVLYWYGVPYLIVNLFLVLITFLQHTDLRLPHYTGKEWDWLRGALATIDRDYGIWNHICHHITDTHVVHHLFSNMPHYHALEATRYVKPLLGDYYAYDNTPIPLALWKIYGRCQAVKPDSKNPNIMWF
jgi:omega-6 fatty acid desaturase (delta-12 desaturase)